MALSPLSRLVRSRALRLRRGANRWSICPRLREDHHDADHVRMDRAVIVVGPGVGEGDAVTARKGESGADRRIQILLVQQDARSSSPIDVGITWQRRGLAELSEVVHLVRIT